MYKTCVKCRTINRVSKQKYRASVKDGTYEPKPPKQNRFENIDCDVCGKTVQRMRMDKHRMNPSCKKTSNINKYATIHNGYRLMDYKHICNGDFDFEGVIKLHDDERIKHNNYR